MKLMGKEEIKRDKKELEILKKRIKELRVEYKSYRMCCCNNKDVHGTKVFHRDYNGAKNIMYVMIQKVTGKEIGKFSRKVKLDAKGMIKN